MGEGAEEAADVPKERKDKMLKHLAKHVKAAIQARQSQNISKTG